MVLLSNPNLPAKTVTTPVETIQVAPTILKGLQLDLSYLEAVRNERHGSSAGRQLPFLRPVIQPIKRPNTSNRSLS
jgi:hypothetical protein